MVMKASASARLLVAVAAFAMVSSASAQQESATNAVSRTDLLKRVLPSGDFRQVEAVMIDLPPGAAAPRHRHDVAVVAYVIEGTVENQFDGGAVQMHKTGDSWFEAPGTVHDTARNASGTARARLLVVYIGEIGKPQTVRLR
jgi:quercetin dioxygenase-like cupin family protein